MMCAGSYDPSVAMIVAFYCTPPVHRRKFPFSHSLSNKSFFLDFFDTRAPRLSHTHP